MCVYISITPTGSEIESRYNKIFFPEDKDLFTGIYFTSAFSNPKLPVITNSFSSTSTTNISSINNSDDHIKLYEWGLIPFWVKDEKSAIDIQKKTYNARCETIFDKPSFKQSILKKRCLIIADGFFEWKEVNGIKYPFYIRLTDQIIFSFAGIYDNWRGLNTFSIITTEANNLMKNIHNIKKRMPVILKKEDESKWLSDISVEEIKSLMTPYNDQFMEAYPVSRLITEKGTKNNDPEVIKKYDYKELEK